MCLLYSKNTSDLKNWMENAGQSPDFLKWDKLVGMRGIEPPRLTTTGP